ncbi:MBL fold metallo-hydrolase [Halomonas nitroreducens]|uniref:MBL fold metallo-hydrolase n=1 Tax=Halomonas nitroreducens TaxID=447425 RepID=A0A431V7M3_9GAMM|nr:MBL fold metallo-hydrolase [Halomonas nitroreducens]RTR05506.1 MBL fold metallo-hydrolase [Halomonas nitroreducens]
MPEPTPLPADHPLLALLRRHQRVLLAGAPGTGKTTLAAAAATALARRGVVCRCLTADPGLPGFGPPGAVALGVWRGAGWYTERLAALCSLDAARFRLPLVDALRRLAAHCPPGPLLIDAPGVVRGAGAAELLLALAGVGDARALALLVPEGAAPPLADECRALGLPCRRLAPAAEARHPGKLARKQRRTVAWQAWLDGAGEQALALDGLAMLGTPPPRSAPEAWRGRQVGLLDAHGETLALGEVVALTPDCLRVRVAAPSAAVAAVVIRDAHRDRDGVLGTAPRHRHIRAAGALPELTHSLPPATADGGPRPVVRLERAVATLVNGVFGDPLLHLRLRHQRRSLLFDLGDAGRLPARLAHQVSDVFISHAHFDHIGGFPWLLRSRIGDYPPCRLYGPPGLAEHVRGLMSGVLWDRVGDKAPRFEVAELHGERLVRHALVAGRAPEALPTRRAEGGRLLEEPGFGVRATTLDHGTPVLAFAFEPHAEARVRKARLAARGWPPGPWLGELKRRMLAGQADAPIQPPGGTPLPAATLAAELLEMRSGQRLVYATDLGDTPDNRRRLQALARNADVLVCEAPFLEAEADQARRTGHLTARACGEIARAAGVAQLVPFHFSRRHAADPRPLYDEIRPHYPGLAVPTAD